MRLLNASGCLDALAAPDVARALDGFVTKTVTPLPREGNTPPRIAETAHGMLNAIGLANPGRERFLSDNLRACASSASRSGSVSAASVPRTTRRRAAGSRRSRRSSSTSRARTSTRAADSAAEIVAACRAATELPLYAKLSAAHPDVAEVARAVAAGGASGLSLINTLRAVALDRNLRPTPRSRQRRPTRDRRSSRSPCTPSARVPRRLHSRSWAWAE